MECEKGKGIVKKVSGCRGKIAPLFELDSVLFACLCMW